MLDGLVRHGILSEVSSHHLGLDLHTDVRLARVHTNHGTDHFGHDDHVTKVSLDDLGLLVHGALLLGLSQLLEENAVLLGETPREPAADTVATETQAIHDQSHAPYQSPGSVPHSPLVDLLLSKKLERFKYPSNGNAGIHSTITPMDTNGTQKYLQL